MEIEMGCEEDTEELYADLYEHLGDGRQVPKTSLLEMEERMDELTKQGAEMQSKILTLEKQNNSLQEEKNILICNISSLFKTAQMEIGRKNKQINELRQEISQLKIQVPCSSSLIPTTAQLTAKSGKLSHDKPLMEVQNKSYRETKHAGEMQERARISRNDSKTTKNRLRDETTPNIRSVALSNIERTVPFVRDANRPKNIDVQARASEQVNDTQYKSSLNSQCVNRKELCRLGHDNFRGCLPHEKLIEPNIDSRNDQQPMHMQKKDRVGKNPMRDCSSLGSMEGNADKTILGNTAMKSIDECDIVSGNGNCIGLRNSGLNRKFIDADDSIKLDSSEDPSTCRIQQIGAFMHSRDDKKQFSSEDSAQSGVHKLLGKQYKISAGEDKNFGKVHVTNIFESGQDHETKSWMNEARVPEHGNKSHLCETTGPERLSFILDETHGDCREEVQRNGEQRKRSKDSELPEIMGADKGDIWSANAVTYSRGVGHELLDGGLQNGTVIKGQGMQANGIKSSISLPEINNTDSTVYSFVNGDNAQAGFKMQLGLDETSKDLRMLRELNVAMPKEAGAINHRAEQMKDISQKHPGESIFEKTRKFRVSPERSSWKRDSKNILQHEKGVKYEKKEKCFDLSFSRKRGFEEMKDTHTNKNNDSRQGIGNISDDHSRKKTSFSSDIYKRGRRGHAHKVQGRNGFESGQDHETRSRMKEARVQEHDNKPYLSETTGPEKLSFISDETHEDCREHRRKMSKHSELPEIMGAGKSDISSSNAGTYLCEVGHVLLADSLQNTVVTKGQGMRENSIKSSIPLPEINHTDSTVYSFVNGDGSEAGFKLQLRVDGTPKDLGMSRELNVEIPDDAAAANYRAEEMKDSNQRHHQRTISEKARIFGDFPDRSSEKRDSEKVLQHGKEAKYEKRERCSDFSFSRKKGKEEMRGTHTNKGNNNREGNGSISNDHSRKNSSFSFDMNEEGRRGSAHQVQARNGFDSGEHHETRPWMDETRVSEHGIKTHLSDTEGPESLSFIPDEIHEDSREEVQTNGEQRRNSSKDREVPEIMGADKGDIWSNNAVYSCEVGHVLLEDSLENTTVIKGQSMQADNIKSFISLPEANLIDSTDYSANGDGAQAGSAARSELQLDVVETKNDLVMSREVNVEMPKETGATNYREEDMKDSSQSHHGESISERARKFQVSPDKSREKRDSKNILQHGKKVEYEKKGRCSAVSCSRKRGIEEMKDTHTNKDNDSRQGNGNISNDHSRKNSSFSNDHSRKNISFSSDMNKQGRREYAHQVTDLRKSAGDKFDHRRQHPINGERVNIWSSFADGARDEAMSEQDHAYGESGRGGRNFLHKGENFKTTSRSERHAYSAERDKYKRRDRRDQCDDMHKSRRS